MTKQGSSSITGRGFRRRLRSFLTGQSQDTSKHSDVEPSEPIKHSVIKNTSSEVSTSNKTSINLDPPNAPAEETPVTNTEETAETDLVQVSTAPQSFAERIAKGQRTSSEVDPSTAPSFTSGPAAQQAAQKLAKDASTKINEVGISYWGPLDNESARSKAAGETLVIDQEECISCGTCVENTEHVFYLPDDAKAVPIEQEGPMDLIQDAIDACPVACIHWSHTPQHYPQLNDRHGKPIT